MSDDEATAVAVVATCGEHVIRGKLQSVDIHYDHDAVGAGVVVMTTDDSPDIAPLGTDWLGSVWHLSIGAFRAVRARYTLFDLRGTGRPNDLTFDLMEPWPPGRAPRADA